ncbi:hypothetical protein HYW35_03595 [Candidatus Saccharibacteria bacterium]|nr:hypothetical protein [Candidatus Saccharibacteria bacterium]
MDPAAAKQQIVERIKQASNILVTVSNNPSVDQLSACIGLTLLLNKMDKHATAVFSGQVPSTIEFLQPEKTIETNTDSLQDFIISLDKNKADKLRYKVEDQVVRIFITPYKTSLSEKDLVFSLGDFNVEVVLALGVQERTQLDAAITTHGRILHDATVIALEAGKGNAPNIGQINWQDPTASSLSEMLVSISEAFGTGLIDNQMATAFLTGIVAETHRFSNDKTSPRVMAMAAQLMAAGANQQLIVSKLEPPPPPAAPVAQKYTPPPPPPGPSTGVLNVPHKAEKDDSQEVEVNSGEIHIDEKGNIVSDELPAGPPPGPKITPARALPEPEDFKPPAQPISQNTQTAIPGPHSLLNPREHQPSISPPFTADTKPEWYDPYNTVPLDPLSGVSRPDDIIIDQAGSLQPAQAEPSASSGQTSAPTAPTVNSSETEPPSDLPTQAGTAQAQLPAAPPPIKNSAGTPGIDSARGAVQGAIDAAPFDPSGKPLTALGAQPLSSDLHGKMAPPTDQKPADSLPPPPPLPPPLTPSPGVVIPDPAPSAGQNKPK